MAAAAWRTHLDEAVRVAEAAGEAGEVPVGAVLVDADGGVLASAANERERSADPTAHAEILALRRGAERAGDGWRLDGTTLVVTLEPCAMCAGAMINARVARCVFGAWDPKAGACGSVWDLVRDPRTTHTVEILGGVDEKRCGGLLEDFFGVRR